MIATPIPELVWSSAEFFDLAGPVMSQVQSKIIPPSARWFRWAIAFVWLSSGLLVFHSDYREIGKDYLDQLGLPLWLMYATCAAEVLLGLYVAAKPARGWVTCLQVVLIVGFRSRSSLAISPASMVFPRPTPSAIRMRGRSCRRAFAAGWSWYWVLLIAPRCPT